MISLWFCTKIYFFKRCFSRDRPTSINTKNELWRSEVVVVVLSLLFVQFYEGAVWSEAARSWPAALSLTCNLECVQTPLSPKKRHLNITDSLNASQQVTASHWPPTPATPDPHFCPCSVFWILTCGVQRLHGGELDAGGDSRLVDGLSPVWIRVQVKHGDAPRVHGQRDGEDAQDVHDDAGLHLRGRVCVYFHEQFHS